MRSKTMYVGLVLIAFMSGFHFHGSMTISSGQVYAQTSLPRVALNNLVYQGAFRVPQGLTDQSSFSYGGTAITFNPANNSLFMTGHDSYQRSAEMSIPALVNNSSINNLNTATLLQLFADATDGKLNQINPSDPNWKKIGGHLVYSGELYVTGYSYYDGGGSQVLSHFVSGTNLSVSNDAQGPYQVGNWAGIASGYMTTIPPEWRSLFGGPALTGNCCLSIISRTSLGPAASVFNPSDVGVKNPIPATPVVHYDINHPTLGTCDTSYAQYFNCVTQIRGLVFPGGTRSVLFFGRQGTGAWCYGTGGSSGGDCYDPASIYKGGHAYPYVYQVWAYDANDLLSVKNGQKNPWDIRPYAVWKYNLPFEKSSDLHDVGGAAYDPATQRIYISQMCADTGCNPIIHVFKVNVGSSSADTTPPSPPTALKVQ
jgi:hypothetical protein